ncbi:hypothetical protein GCM10027425_09260 [Alteromonas gracilis]
MTSSRATGVRIDGLKKLRRDLRRLGSDLSDFKDANAAAASLVASEAAKRAPRRPGSGRLARSGRGNRAAGRASVLFGGAAVPYAGPIHWGWTARGIEPQPFVAAAAQDTEARWLPLYTDAIDAAVDKVAGRTY